MSTVWIEKIYKGAKKEVLEETEPTMEEFLDVSGLTAGQGITCASIIAELSAMDADGQRAKLRALVKGDPLYKDFHPVFAFCFLRRLILQSRLSPLDISKTFGYMSRKWRERFFWRRLPNSRSIWEKDGVRIEVLRTSPRRDACRR
jgi:hypothetical protein